MLEVKNKKSVKTALTAFTILIVTYTANYWCYAGLWIICLPIDLVVILYFSSVFIASIVWGIKDSKKYQQPFAPLFINSLAAIIIWCLPSIYQSKAHHVRTYALTNRNNCGCKPGLFVEHYTASAGGAWGTDLESVFLSDKKNFRLFIGYYEDNREYVHIKCEGDIIKVVQYNTEGISTYWSELIISDKKKFSLNWLISNHVFD